MAELRIGSCNENIAHYKTTSQTKNNFDISVNFENGDVLEINSRHSKKTDGFVGGYACRLHRKGKGKRTLIDVDF